MKLCTCLDQGCTDFPKKKKNVEATPIFEGQMHDTKSSPPHTPIKHMTHILKIPFFSSPSDGRSIYILAKGLL